MKASKTILFIIITVVCLSFLACKQGTDVVGKWKNVNLPETVEFHNDRTGTFNVQNSPSLPFKWMKLPDGRIQLTLEFMGKPRTLYGRVEKENTFVLTGQGEQAIYNRMK